MEFQRPSQNELKLFVAFILIFTLFIHWGGVNSWSRYDLTKSITEDQSTDISPYAYNTMDKYAPMSEYHEAVNASSWWEAEGNETEARRLVENIFWDNSTRIYTGKAPFSSFIAVPGYLVAEEALELTGAESNDVWMEKGVQSIAISLSDATAFKQFFVLFTASVLFGSALIVLIYRHLIRHTKKEAAFYTSMIIGVGTPLTYYATSFYGIINAAFFGFTSFLALEKLMEGHKVMYAYLAGILSAFAFSTEYYAVIIAGFLALYLISRREYWNAGRFIAGVLIGSIPLLLYNWATTGNPVVPVLISSNFMGPGPINVFCSIYTACGTDLLLSMFVKDPVRIVNSAFRLLFFETRGLFFFSPVLLISLPGMYELYRKDRRLLIVFPGVFLGLIFFQAGVVNWLAGGSFGPRYALVGLPFLALPFALGLQKMLEKGRIWRLFVLVTVIISAFNTAAAFNLGAPIVSGEEYEERFSSFSAVQPESYDALIEDFSRYGARSEVLMSLTDRKKGFDVTYNSPYGPGALTITSLQHSDLLIHTGLMPIIVALAVLGIIFRNKSVVFSKLIPAAILVMLLLSISTSSKYMQGEKYDVDESLGAVDGEASIVIYTDEGEVPYIDMRTASPDGEEFNITATVNGDKIRSVNQSGSHTFYFPSASQERRNRIELKADRCIIPANKTDSEDSRCLSMIIDQTGTLHESKLQDFILLEGWYQQGEFSPPVWMTQKSFMAFNSRQTSGFVGLNMTKMQGLTGDLPEAKINGELVEKYPTDTGFAVPLDGDEGWNMLSLEAEDCVVPAEEFNSTDDRCLSYNLDDVYTSNIVYGSGWYSRERDGGETWRWMSRESKTVLDLYGESNVHLAAKPYPGMEDAELEVVLNGEKLRTVDFEKAREKEIDIGLEEGISALNLKSSKGCMVPEAGDERCLSFMFTDISLRNDGWSLIDSRYFTDEISMIKGLDVRSWQVL